MALPSAHSSLSQSLLGLLLLLGAQLTVTARTNWTSQRSQVRPSPTDRCRSDEYWSAGHCCQLCPKGEYVRAPCSRPHTRGQCEKCDRETFTAFPNNLESCLLCATCSKDQVVVMECTATSDRTCQCRAGHYYPGEEGFCTRCSTCPKGTVVLRQCNSTADTVCGPPSPGSRHRFSLISSFLFSLFVLTIIYLCLKKPKDGGFQPVCCGLPNGVHSELEPLEERTQDRGESLGPESSVSSGSSHGNQEADPPGPRTGEHSLSACSLDLASEAPMLPSTLESLSGGQEAKTDDGAALSPEARGRPCCRPVWS